MASKKALRKARKKAHRKLPIDDELQEFSLDDIAEIASSTSSIGLDELLAIVLERLTPAERELLLFRFTTSTNFAILAKNRGEKPEETRRLLARATAKFLDLLGLSDYVPSSFHLRKTNT